MFGLTQPFNYKIIQNISKIFKEDLKRIIKYQFKKASLAIFLIVLIVTVGVMAQSPGISVQKQTSIDTAAETQGKEPEIQFIAASDIPKVSEETIAHLDEIRRIEVNVGVAYGNDPNRVLKILHKVAEDHPVVLDNPAPMVLFQGFGESSLDFSLRVWTSDFDNWLSFSSDITLQVHNALKKAGIEIPFPQRDLHLRSVESKDISHLLKPTQKRNSGKGKAAELEKVKKV